VVSLNSGKQGSPIFLVHPAGGSASGYIQLAQNLSRPVYAFQANPNVISTYSSQSLSSLASAYFNEMRTLQSKGPYCLAGWSSGGALAHAIAELIESLGDSVEQLILLDAPSPYLHRNQDAKTLMKWFVEDLNQDLPIEKLDQIDYNQLNLEEQLAAAIDVLTPFNSEILNAQQLLPAFIVYDYMIKAVAKHSAGVLKCDITVIRVSENIVSEFFEHPGKDSQDWGWASKTNGKINCYIVDGNHHNFLIGDRLTKILHHFNNSLSYESPMLV
jgi:thioesterase domain-containing protein